VPEEPESTVEEVHDCADDDQRDDVRKQSLKQTKPTTNY